MRTIGVLLLGAVVAGACGDESAGPASGRLAFPLAGTLNRTFFYVNYVDRLAGAGTQDFNCGTRTYDGHQGTDILLPSFRTMDSGVPVLAAAPGTVVGTHDGEFDRQTTWVAGAQWNYVAIRHADGIDSWYGHLKRGSVRVSVGQDVAVGTELGHVGSSGISDMPHLHFELRDATGAFVDPWQGPCGAAQSRWGTQHAYDQPLVLITSGLTDTDALTIDMVKQPPVHVSTFSTSSPRVTMWVELGNLPLGSTSVFRMYQPNGSQFAAVTLQTQSYYGLSWWWMYHTIPGFMTQTGTWRIEYHLDGVKRAEQSFNLVTAAADVAARAPVSGPPFGGGGGPAGSRTTRRHVP